MAYAAEHGSDEGAEDGAFPHAGRLRLLFGLAFFFLAQTFSFTLFFTTTAFSLSFCITLELFFLTTTAFCLNGFSTFLSLLFLLHLA